MFKYFTIQTANETLPLVIEKYANIKKQKNEVIKAEQQLQVALSDNNTFEQYVVLKQKLNEEINELKFAQKEEMSQRKDLLKDSIKILNDREKKILYARRLNDKPTTLENLSKKYKISRERIRQIENKAFEKVQKHMLNAAKSRNLLPAN